MAGTLPGCVLLGSTVRGYRFAQPPATGWQTSGLPSAWRVQVEFFLKMQEVDGSSAEPFEPCVGDIAFSGVSILQAYPRDIRNVYPRYSRCTLYCNSPNCSQAATKSSLNGRARLRRAHILFSAGGFVGSTEGPTDCWLRTSVSSVEWRLVMGAPAIQPAPSRFKIAGSP